MKIKIIHIVTDDKFIDGAIGLFETDNRVENTYIIIGEKRDFKYLKNDCVKWVLYEDALEVINKFDVVVLHSLPAIPIELISDIKKNIKVVWFAWGYDLYEKPYSVVPIKLLGPETKKATRYERFRQFIRVSSHKQINFYKKHLPNALERIDYFSGVFPYEHNLVKSEHPEFRALPLDFYYGSTNFFIPEEPSKSFNHGKYNVIIGNSANTTGNHLDVLKAMNLVKIDKQSKVIIPLSYNGSPRYVSQVEKKAESLYPGQIVSLRNYLPLDEYLELISNCRVAVFAHERQQASDNIFMQLIYGAKVYMSETSAAFDYLKSIGLRIFSLQSDLANFYEELSDEDVMANREILSSLYSSSKLIERVKTINTTLIESFETC